MKLTITPTTKLAVHKCRTNGRYPLHKIIIGENPYGPKGGTSGEWVDAKDPFSSGKMGQIWFDSLLIDLSNIMKNNKENTVIDTILLERLSRKRSNNIGMLTDKKLRGFDFLEEHPNFKTKTEITNFMIYEFQADYHFVCIKVPKSADFNVTTHFTFIDFEDDVIIEKKLKKKEYPNWFKELEKQTVKKCDQIYRIRKIFQ